MWDWESWSNTELREMNIEPELSGHLIDQDGIRQEPEKIAAIVHIKKKHFQL